MSNAGVLEKIAGHVSKRLDDRKLSLSLPDLKALSLQSRQPQGFRASLTANTTSKPAVIAEIKFASPSQGTFDVVSHFSPVEVASEYLQNGARALSVLTEVDHFRGQPEFLVQVRKAHPRASLLMKDFIVDEYQIFEARHLGADAILLIVALLGRKKTEAFYRIAQDLKLDVLVEVHDEAELTDAELIGADLIGVNNRNLKTLEVSTDVSFRLADKAMGKALLVAESGLSQASEIAKLQKVGFFAFLMGTSFMKTGKPGAALKTLLADYAKVSRS